MEKLSTLCYIEQNHQYLMLHRTVKKHDVNKDKWIGVGGHFEKNESPEECLLREVWEETGYTLTSYRFRGLVTFVYGEDVPNICLFLPRTDLPARNTPATRASWNGWTKMRFCTSISGREIKFSSAF